MRGLIIEENVGFESAQEFSLLHPAQKQGFIQTYIPGPQGSNDTLMSRCPPRRDKRRTDGVLRLGKFLLQSMQCCEEGLEWPTAKRVIPLGDAFAQAVLPRQYFARGLGAHLLRWWKGTGHTEML